MFGSAEAFVADFIAEKGRKAPEACISIMWKRLALAPGAGPVATWEAPGS